MLIKLLRSLSSTAVRVLPFVLVAGAIGERIDRLENSLVAKYDDLRAAVTGVSAAAARHRQAVDAAVTRISDKIAELGEPDPDFAEQLAALSSTARQLDEATSVLEGVAPAEPLPEPVEVPTEEPEAPAAPEAPEGDTPPADVEGETPTA